MGCVTFSVAVRQQRPHRLLGTGRALTRLVQVQCCFTCPQRPYGLLIRDVESNGSVGRTSVRGLWTLSCDFVHHFLLKHKKMALIAAHHNAGVILVVTV